MQHYNIIHIKSLDNGNQVQYTTDAEGVETDGTQTKVAGAAYSLVESRISHLSGRIFTLIDASIADKDQKKAIKDIIRGFIAEEFSFFADILTPQLMKDSLAQFDEMSEEEFEKWAEENPGIDIDQVILKDK